MFVSFLYLPGNYLANAKKSYFNLFLNYFAIAKQHAVSTYHVTTHGVMSVKSTYSALRSLNKCCVIWKIDISNYHKL